MAKSTVNQRFRLSIEYIISQKIAKNKKEIASVIDIRPSTLSEILKDRMSLGLYMIEPYCVKYGISVDWLVTGRGSMMQQDLDTLLTSLEKEEQHDKIISLLNQSLKEHEEEINRLLTIIEREQSNHHCHLSNGEQCPITSKK